jgi:hypothetical protein
MLPSELIESLGIASASCPLSTNFKSSVYVTVLIVESVSRSLETRQPLK